MGAPPILPAGAEMAVLAGDPSASGMVTIRVKMPAGYKIPPHFHPTDEHVTVISGTFALGMGDTLDPKKSKTLKAGGYGVATANMHHFAWTANGAVVQVNMLGPFKITYVNPAAEQFFDTGAGILVKQFINDLLPFDSPLFQLINQARERNSSASERDVDLSTARHCERFADVTVTPLPEPEAPLAISLQ